MQESLATLGYWLGEPDGNYGYLTEQAVLALQKAAGLTRDGRAGPRTLAALAARIQPAPRRTTGTGIEIDLEHQLLLYVREGELNQIFNTSTGSGGTYWQGGVAHAAVTPTGTFTVFREVNAADVSPLGVLWRPKYFIGGVAIHGYSDVPAYPASHGCVRLTNAAMDFVWATGIAPVGTSVWVY
jgi:lipoprotein-anchoring transpeptidase ErfK/SrfK